MTFVILFVLEKSMRRKKQEVPPISPWEMELMQVLWNADGVTILQAQQAIDRPIGYTTVQTRLNRLVEKGLAQKSPQRPTRYLAAVPPDTVSAGHLDLLLERVSDGNVVPLIAQLMKDRPFSNDEIHELKNLVKQLEQ
jgi:predicted transcriptional regulator